MDNQNFSFKDPIEVQSVNSVGSEVATRTFMARVFTWMTLGLGITGILAYAFANTGLISMVFEAGRPTPLFYIATFAPLAIILIMGLGVNRLSYMAMAFTFILYSSLMGISLSVIFLAYAKTSIYSMFFVTSGIFGLMAFLGYTTSTDLTKFGTLLYIALFGVIISWIINYFMHSATLDYALNFICVAIFTGLTAYKVQMLKNMSVQVTSAGEGTMGKMAVWGALSLYITFINLFLTLLRIFGNRR